MTELWKNFISIQNFPCCNWTYRVTEILLGNIGEEILFLPLQYYDKQPSSGTRRKIPLSIFRLVLWNSFLLPFLSQENHYLFARIILLRSWTDKEQGWWEDALQKVLMHRKCKEVFEARILSLGQSIRDSFMIKTRLETLTYFSMELRFPYLNRVSIYWILHRS